MALFSFLKFSKKGALEKKGPASRRQKKKTDTSQLKRKLPGGIGWICFFSIMLIWASCCFSILYRIHKTPVLVPRQKAPETIFAKMTFVFEDKVKTDLRRDDAAKGILSSYTYNKKAFREKINNLEYLLNYLQRTKDGATPLAKDDPELKDQPFKAFLHQEIKEKAIAAKLYETLAIGSSRIRIIRILEDMSRYDNEDWLPVVSDLDFQREEKDGAYGERLKLIGSDKEERRLNRDKLASPHTFAEKFLTRLQKDLSLPPPTQSVKDILTDLFTTMVVPDVEYDSKTTTAEREKARFDVKMITKVYRKDSTLLVKGKAVTESDIHVVNTHSKKFTELQKKFGFDDGVRASWCLWITIAFFFLLFIMLPEFSLLKKNLLLGSIVVSFNIIMLWTSDYLITDIFQQDPRYVMAALPLAFSAIMMTILFSPKEGVLFGVLVTLLHAIQTGDSTSLIMTLGLVTSVASALTVRSVRTRLQISRIMLYLPLFSFLIMALYLALKHQDAQVASYLNCMWISIVSAGIIVILVNLFLPLFEFIFGLTTDISLLELSDLNHPLLRRLSLEAPGTYTHTMMVATLAEHAAEAIGANTLLTRVMSYFHDIGKLSNPIYFTENSFGANHHEDLSPKMSARIIQNHVKEGLAMAAKYKLKVPLREAIATHHGNGLVYFFYHRAKTENSLADSGGESEYRYPGPNPRSPEATIIALADSCEAASRSLEKPSPQKIDALVDDIFKGKLLGGQLDETELSMAQLNTVLSSIKKTIRVMLHGRIAYPKNEELEKKLKTAGFAEKSREVESTRLMNLRKDKTTELKLDGGNIEPDALTKGDAPAEKNTKTEITTAVAVDSEDIDDNTDKSPEADTTPGPETPGDTAPEGPSADTPGETAEERPND